MTLPGLFKKFDIRIQNWLQSLAWSARSVQSVQSIESADWPINRRNQIRKWSDVSMPPSATQRHPAPPSTQPGGNSDALIHKSTNPWRHEQASANQRPASNRISLIEPSIPSLWSRDAFRHPIPWHWPLIAINPSTQLPIASIYAHLTTVNLTIC